MTLNGIHMQQALYLKLVLGSGLLPYSKEVAWRKIREVCVSRIRSVLEYVCPTWNPGLAKHHIHDIKIVQKRAMFIIEPNLSYHLCPHLKIVGTSYVRNAFKQSNNQIMP